MTNRKQCKYTKEDIEVGMYQTVQECLAEFAFEPYHIANCLSCLKLYRKIQKHVTAAGWDNHHYKKFIKLKIRTMEDLK